MSKQDGKIFLDGATSSPIVSFSGSSDLTTEAIDLTDWDGQWLLYFWGDSAPNGQTITIQVSPDGTNWFDYKDEAVEVPFNDYFWDERFPHRFLRLDYKAGSYTGNITFKFYQL